MFVGNGQDVHGLFLRAWNFSSTSFNRLKKLSSLYERSCRWPALAHLKLLASPTKFLHLQTRLKSQQSTALLPWSLSNAGEVTRARG